jgi:hypothetical protein
MMLKHVFHSFVCILIAASLLPAEPPSVSGIYPHLAMFNEAGECGTGAVVPWAERLWVITYAPHKPQGSSDKLYEITPDLKQIIRPESVGGTPANRMIHRESQQLFIGPYAIDAQRKVRVIPYSEMLGRPTGNARHLVDPANKIYYATMEEGFYEVDVKTLAVKELYPDNHAKKESIYSQVIMAKVCTPRKVAWFIPTTASMVRQRSKIRALLPACWLSGMAKTGRLSVAINSQR